MSAAFDSAEFDLAVVGAGPAGMAAAATASELGLSSVLLDENPGPGGQIYRAIAASPVQRRGVLGGDYWRGAEAVRRLQRSSAAWRPRTAVWSLQAGEEGVELGTADEQGARMLRARYAVVATGAMERPFPIPGWTLPGVMTVGAAQTLLKASGIVPRGQTVIAGSGPLLYLYAWQLIAAGAPPALLLDTTPRRNWRQAVWHLPAFLASGYSRKGLALLAAVRRRVPVIGNVALLRAEGEDRVREIVWRSAKGEARRQVDLLLLHQGVVPNINLWSAADCASQWDEVQACWHASVDAWGQSSRERIFIAGDGAGIAGAEAAGLRGQLAAVRIAELLGRLTSAARGGHARDMQRALAVRLRGRDFLDALYRPADWARRPAGDTVVCRCEEISAARIVATIRQGCSGPNQLKAYIRCGMGPCQGRQCGLTVTELMAHEKAAPPAAIGHFRLRPPVKPLALGALAAVPASEAEKASVIRF
ncbi:MAG: NAD(P)/FAD-dependent oxidoreductase [Reyranellaceae bacterium]